MENLTLRQLRYFKALASEGQFGRAAQSCSISQAALSIQIKQLEEALGLALLERGPRSVQLTARGQAFLTKADAILAAVDDVKDWSQSEAGAGLTELRLGIIPTMAPYLLPKLLSALNGSRPDMKLYIRETMTHRLNQGLIDGSLDAAILALPLEDPKLATMKLFDEELVLARPLAQAQAPKPSLESLSHMQLLLLEEGNCLRDNALTFCELNKVSFRGMLEGSTLATLTQLVEAGLGVTLLPQMAVGAETLGRKIDVSRFQDPAPIRTVGLAWRRRNPMGREYKLLGEEITALAQSLK